MSAPPKAGKTPKKPVPTAKPATLAPIFKTPGEVAKTRGVTPKPPSGLSQGYKIPKVSQKPRKEETAPPPKRARLDKTHEMSDEGSDLDYDDTGSDIEYPIEFEEEEYAESEAGDIVDRIDELLRSPPHSHVVSDGQQPSTSRGTVAPAVIRPDLLEQGEIPETNEEDTGLAEIVQELSNDDDVGPDVNTQLATIFTKLLGSRLPAERIKAKMDENPPPGNVPMMQPPRVNDVLWNSLDQPARELDMKHKRIQAKLTRGLSALARLTETILTHKKTATLPDFTALLERAMTAFALLSSANYELSLRRREVMRFDLNPRFARLCFASTPVTTDLFGDEMQKMVEDIQRSHKLERNITYRGKRGGYQNRGGRGGNNRGRGGQSNRGNRQYYNGSNPNNSYNNNSYRGGRGNYSKNSKRGANKRQQ